MDYIYKPVDFARASCQPVTDILRRAISKVYCALFLLSFGAFVGAHMHVAYGCGGPNSATRVFVGFIWLQVLHQRSIWARLFCLMSSAVSFGATVGSLLSHFMEVDPEGQRDAIHELTTLTAPLMTTLWTASSKYIPETHLIVGYLLFVSALLCIAVGGQRVPVLRISMLIHIEFISLFSFCFKYSYVTLLVIYLVTLFFLVHLRMHTIHSMGVAAQVGGNDFIVTASITFFTEFVGRSVYLVIYLATRLGVMVYQYLGNLLAFE